MIVDVVMALWELQSEGEPFSVGEEVTWVVYAADEPGRERRRLVATFNEYGPGDELYDLTGVVRRIQEVSFGLRELPGTYTRQTVVADRIVEDVSSATGNDHPEKGRHLSTLLIELEVVPDDVPPVRWDDPGDGGEHEHVRAEAERASLLSTPAGAALARFYDDVMAGTLGRAVVAEGSGPLGVTFRPLNDAGSELRWVVSPEGPSIRVRAGMGSWRFPFDLDGVAEVERFAWAVTRGGVRDGRSRRRVWTRVRASDGSTWRDEEAVPLGIYVRVVGHPDRFRVRPARYAPW